MSAWAVLGRERELAELDRAWADAAAGAGCLLVLDGEAGIGKTALAARLVEAAGVTAVWVPCVDQAVPAPQGVLQAVTAGLGLPLEPTDSAVDSDARVVALAQAFAHSMVNAVDRPRLVIIDDVQWADEVSLRVLALAAPQVSESRVLVVATVRTGEALPPARRSALNGMLRAARRLPVLPLADDAAGQVADAAVPRALPSRVRRAVLARARGNPLFLRELAILASIDPQRAVDAASLLETVRSVVERRLDSVDAATRSELQQLAVCGDDLAYPIAAAVLERPVDDVLDLAAHGADTGVLQPASLGPVRFTHPLVRDALAAASPGPGPGGSSAAPTSLSSRPARSPACSTRPCFGVPSPASATPSWTGSRPSTATNASSCRCGPHRSWPVVGGTSSDTRPSWCEHPRRCPRRRARRWSGR